MDGENPYEKTYENYGDDLGKNPPGGNLEGDGLVRSLHKTTNAWS